MLGPVMTRSCSASGSRRASLRTKPPPATASTTGWPPARVDGRHEWQVRARNLGVVAEHRVAADLERRDARALALRRLEAREPAPGVARRLAQLVHLSVAPGADEAGESRVRRGRVDERGGDRGRDRGEPGGRSGEGPGPA